MKLEYMLGHMPENIRRQALKRTYQPGETVVRKGDRADHVYLLVRGRLRISNEFESGQRYTFASLEVPDLIGELEVLAGQEYFAATGEAATACEVLSLNARTFLAWMQADTEFAIAVARLLAAKMYPTSQDAGRLRFQPSLARFQEYLARQLGEIKTPLFILHVNRQQIADRLGTSVKTVNRCVARLKEEGRLGLLHGKITLNEPQQKELRALLANK